MFGQLQEDRIMKVVEKISNEVSLDILDRFLEDIKSGDVCFAYVVWRDKAGAMHVRSTAIPDRYEVMAYLFHTLHDLMD